MDTPLPPHRPWPGSPSPGWVGLAPGVGLAVGLEGVEVAELDDPTVIDVIIAAERQIAHLRAIQFRAAVGLSRRESYVSCGDDPDANSVRHSHSPVTAVGSELSAAMAWSPRQADTRVALAVELAEDLPATLGALDTGRVDEQRAALIAGKTRVLGLAARREVEQQVLPSAGERTVRQLGRLLDRLVIKADPGAAERRRERGRADRRVERPRPLDGADGVAELVLTGPAEDLVAFYTAVDAAARAARRAESRDGGSRTLDQLRFDVATGLGWTALSLGHLGCCSPDCATTHANAATGSVTPVEAAAGRANATTDVGGVRLGGVRGRPAVVNVTMAFSALVGADDEPAYLDGYGFVTAQTGRDITGDAVLRRILTDPVDGQVLEYGRTTYVPPQALTDFVIARDRTCRFPTSDTPASACDIDHRRPYDRGGTTGASNMQVLSRRFHIEKTLHRWRLDQPRPGMFIWTSPAGRQYRVEPEAIGLIHEPIPTPPTPEPEPPPF